MKVVAGVDCQQSHAHDVETIFALALDWNSIDKIGELDILAPGRDYARHNPS